MRIVLFLAIVVLVGQARADVTCTVDEEDSDICYENCKAPIKATCVTKDGIVEGYIPSIKPNSISIEYGYTDSDEVSTLTINNFNSPLGMLVGLAGHNSGIIDILKRRGFVVDLEKDNAIVSVTGFKAKELPKFYKDKEAKIPLNSKSTAQKEEKLSNISKDSKPKATESKEAPKEQPVATLTCTAVSNARFITNDADCKDKPVCYMQAECVSNGEKVDGLQSLFCDPIGEDLCPTATVCANSKAYENKETKFGAKNSAKAQEGVR